MKTNVLAFVLVLLSCAPALAQRVTPPATEQQGSNSGPCTRGVSQVKIGGMDLDEMRCEMAIMQVNQNQTNAALVKMQAQLQMTLHDAENKDKAVLWWSDCFKRDECISWVRPAGSK